MHQRKSNPKNQNPSFVSKPLNKMSGKVNYHAPEPQPQLTDEEAEIQSLLWPFYNNTEPQTLQDIGFDLNIPPELMHLFLPFSSDSVYEVAGKLVQPLPYHELQSPSQALQIDSTNDSSEGPITTREENGDGSGVISGAVRQSPGVNHSSEEPSWIQGRVEDGSGVTSEASEPALEEQVRSLLTADGSGEISEAKQPMEGEDTENWLPEGWVVTQKKRPLKGKFPGRVDKTYRAPGVARVFRSKRGAQNYIKELENMENMYEKLKEPDGKRDAIGNGSGVISGAAAHSFNHSSNEPSQTQERMGSSSGNGETSGTTKEKKPESGASRKKPVKKRGSINTSKMNENSEPAAI